MAKLLDISNTYAQYFNVYGFNGSGDRGAFRTGYNIEGSVGWPVLNLGGRGGTGTSPTLNVRSGWQVPLRIIEGAAISPLNPVAVAWFQPVSDNTNNPALSVYSLRMLLTIPTPQFANVCIVGFAQDGTTRFQLASYNGGGWGYPGLTGVAGNLSGTYRVEIQVDGNRSPKVISRLYQNDTLVNISNSPHTGNPANVNANQLLFGDLNAAGGGLIWDFAELELWDTYNADEEFGNDWPLAQSGNMAVRRKPYYVPGRYSTPTDVVPSSRTAYINQGYGNFSRTFDLYVPNGRPANGDGYPLVIWAHSGFFALGDKNQLVSHWTDRLLNAGYAVASIRYLRSVITGNAYSNYGTSNADSGGVTAYGRYPSFIIDYKMAALRLRDRYSQQGTNPLLNDNGYGFDKNIMFATGYSAGGYIALGAALTRDLTNDGSSRSLRVSDWSASPNNYRTFEDGTTQWTGADPTFAGTFVYHAPVSLDLAMQWDWAHNNPQATLWPVVYPPSGAQANAGAVHIASRAFMATSATAADPSGSSFTNTSIDNLIDRQYTQNPANLQIPVGYAYSQSDFLVHPAHQDLLNEACLGRVLRYSRHEGIANHDRADDVYDFPALQDFLDTRVRELRGTWAPSALIA